jgi:hypothetical protein
METDLDKLEKKLLNIIVDAINKEGFDLPYWTGFQDACRAALGEIASLRLKQVGSIVWTEETGD